MPIFANDRLFGRTSEDLLSGDRGDDRLEGDPGKDELDGCPSFDPCLTGEKLKRWSRTDA